MPGRGEPVQDKFAALLGQAVGREEIHLVDELHRFRESRFSGTNVLEPTPEFDTLVASGCPHNAHAAPTLGGQLPVGAPLASRISPPASGWNLLVVASSHFSLVWLMALVSSMSVCVIRFMIIETMLEIEALQHSVDELFNRVTDEIVFSGRDCIPAFTIRHGRSLHEESAILN